MRRYEKFFTRELASECSSEVSEKYREDRERV